MKILQTMHIIRLDIDKLELLGGFEEKFAIIEGFLVDKVE